MIARSVSTAVYDQASLDWSPLERFLTAAAERGGAPSPDEFMWMGRCELADGPVIHLYKHAGTRRYLNLDHAGFAYRYLPGDDAGRYEPLRSPTEALAHVIDPPDDVARRVVAQWAAPTTPAASGPSLSP